jgi:lysophospholipase L1-like esterase
MLSREERGWWPWIPLLVVEGLYVRVATARLPPAKDRRGRTGAQTGRAIKIAGLGDSIIAGIGVQSQREGLLGQVSERVAERTGRPVEWEAIGFSGATSQVVLDRLLPEAARAEPELAVLSVGVNDAVRGTRPRDFKDRLAAIVDGLTATRRQPSVVFGGIPPLARFPALPWPLSRVLGGRAARLQQAAIDLTGYRGLKVVVFPSRLARAGFSSDGFHPGPAGCADWSRWVADGMSLRLETLRDARWD